MNPDLSLCAEMWEKISVSVSQVISYRGANQNPDSVLLGFACIHLHLGDTPLLMLPKTAIKLVKGELHFDPQAIEGKGEKVGQYFPTWRPATAEARLVLTKLLELCPEIKALVSATRHQTTSR